VSARFALLATLLAGALGCATVPRRDGPPTRPYATGDLTLLVRYTAKETCSCLYVMQMGKDYCRAWTRASPSVAGWMVNEDKQTVTATALFLWQARAHFVDDQVGCILE
jgi:hypothetical protein